MHCYLAQSLPAAALGTVWGSFCTAKSEHQCLQVTDIRGDPANHSSGTKYVTMDAGSTSEQRLVAYCSIVGNMVLLHIRVTCFSCITWWTSLKTL
jgi:hypothetical protein